jgi:hypothetical protein
MELRSTTRNKKGTQKEVGIMKKQKLYVDYDGNEYTADEGIENHGVIDRCAFCMEERKNDKKNTKIWF